MNETCISYHLVPTWSGFNHYRGTKLLSQTPIHTCIFTTRTNITSCEVTLPPAYYWCGAQPAPFGGLSRVVGSGEPAPISSPDLISEEAAARARCVEVGAENASLFFHTSFMSFSSSSRTRGMNHAEVVGPRGPLNANALIMRLSDGRKFRSGDAIVSV
jgi:hypothetical protein